MKEAFEMEEESKKKEQLDKHGASLLLTARNWENMDLPDLEYNYKLEGLIQNWH